jgi:TonB family protein
MALGIITRINSFPLLRGPAAIMKASLVVSFLFHIVLLICFQKAFPFAWSNPELRTYNIEIVRPPVEGLNKNDTAGTDVDRIDQKEETPSEDSQDTISLDTKDERYVLYAGVIKQRLMQQWVYPDEAKLSLIEGQVLVYFSLQKNGTMTQINIESSSGHDILDKEVIRAVKASSPFPSFPASIKVSRLNIRAKFDYRLSYAKGNK